MMGQINAYFDGFKISFATSLLPQIALIIYSYEVHMYSDIIK